MKHQVPLFVSAAVAAVADASMPSIASVPGAASYVVPTAFPTTVYSSYYGEAPSCVARYILILTLRTSPAGPNSGAPTGHL